MVVVAVMGILAAVAYPSYQSYMMRAHRSAAQQFMMDIAARQEQYLVDQRAYAASLAALNLTPGSDVSQYYTVAIPSVTATPPAYSITATPLPGSAQARDTCGTLTLGSDGSKTVSGTKTAADCWAGR